jgi:hypothetical protein
MQDGALGNGGAFVSAPFGRPPGQRTAGQTLKPSSSAASGKPGSAGGPHVMTAQGGIGTRPTRIRVGPASKPSATARRATYFELSRPFLSHASPRHPAGRPASLFMTVRHGTRYAAMSYVGPPRLRMVRLRGRRPSVTRHGAADAYSADAPEPPPRSWSQRVVEARCQDARVPALPASPGDHKGSICGLVRSWLPFPGIAESAP